MRTTGQLTRTVAVGVLAVMSGCADALSVDVVAVGVSGGAIVSPSDPGVFNVTAENRGDDRVVWGMGSSSCQLGLIVQDVDGEWRSIDFRGCTDDLVEQGLDPGESRTESFEWGGTIVVNGQDQTLPSGQYRVRGVAGSEESESLVVTVVNP